MFAVDVRQKQIICMPAMVRQKCQNKRLCCQWQEDSTQVLATNIQIFLFFIVQIDGVVEKSHEYILINQHNPSLNSSGNSRRRRRRRRTRRRRRRRRRGGRDRYVTTSCDQSNFIRSKYFQPFPTHPSSLYSCCSFQSSPRWSAIGFIDAKIIPYNLG